MALRAIRIAEMGALSGAMKLPVPRRIENTTSDLCERNPAGKNRYGDANNLNAVPYCFELEQRVLQSAWRMAQNSEL